MLFSTAQSCSISWGGRQSQTSCLLKKTLDAPVRCLPTDIGLFRPLWTIGNLKKRLRATSNKFLGK